MNAIEEMYRVARAQSLIALCATVLGYWFTVALIDHVGRFAIQLMGFFFMTVFMLVLAIPYNHWRGHKCASGYCGGDHTVFVVMYSLTFFFANFGPNITTFIVPAEIFPARLRSTCHGEPLSELSGSSTRHKAGMQMKQRKDIEQVEASSRHNVFIGNCYSASPSTIINRFPKVKALTLKGKPRFVDFNLVPKNWGAQLHPWVLSMASAYPWLETLSLNRMTIIDDNLAILANSFPNFKELVLFYCEGFSTGALAMIARKC
ncbi:hypothetical protein KI387_015609, partial [Taxus chinensis]